MQPEGIGLQGGYLLQLGESRSPPDHQCKHDEQDERYRPWQLAQQADHKGQGRPNNVLGDVSCEHTRLHAVLIIPYNY